MMMSLSYSHFWVDLYLGILSNSRVVIYSEREVAVSIIIFDHCTNNAGLRVLGLHSVLRERHYVYRE
jgi:hypothetical protein